MSSEHRHIELLRAKMKCVGVSVGNPDDPEHRFEQVKLEPVYSSDPASENQEWSKWTPAGGLQLTITNPAACGKLVYGQEYYVDVYPAPDADERAVADAKAEIAAGAKPRPFGEVCAEMGLDEAAK